MGHRVLVVENGTDAASEIRSIVENAGHEVVGMAGCGEHAFDLAGETHPDMALVAMELSGIDGIETTRRLIEQGVGAVIILSSHADEQLIKGAALAGAFTYLLKPADPESICANIELAAARASELSVLKKEVEDVRTALETRKLSERAKHILMSRLSLNEEDAFTHLKHKCRNQNKTMRQVADDIILADDVFLRAVEKEPPKKGQ
ncbi:MAG: response regulator [Armatimonadota bacterium]